MINLLGNHEVGTCCGRGCVFGYLLKRNGGQPTGKKSTRQSGDMIHPESIR